jgi:hypothetical protein
MTIRHEGLSRHRLASNPLEKAFAEAWEEQAPRTLGYLLYGQDCFTHTQVTQREAEVAATIIQWLGSPVGSSFVADVLEKHTRTELEARKLERGKK